MNTAPQTLDISIKKLPIDLELQKEPETSEPGRSRYIKAALEKWWSSSITQWLWSSSREHLQVQGESSFFPSVTQIVCPLEYMEQWRGVGERQKCDLFFHCLSSNLIPLSWGLHPKDCSHPLIFPCNEPAWSRGLHLFGASSCICEVRQDVMYNSNSFICLFIFLVVYTIFKTRINLCFK